MYCDGCGTPFNSGTIYCSSCGKRLMPGPVGQAAPMAAVPAAATAAGDGRVQRNINIVAAFWLANGILRLMGLGWLMIFRRLFFDGGLGLATGELGTGPPHLNSRWSVFGRCLSWVLWTNSFVAGLGTL